MSEPEKPCPYRQGDVTYWCLLAEKGSPLTNDMIEFKLRTIGDGVNWTPCEQAAFYAGVRWAEKCHGVTG
jgi:hypothetical protein